MAPPDLLKLPDGRHLAYDDVGAPDGVPVVYLHGTPDSRLARHPDDSIAAAMGVRLIALDRPGSGASDPHPGGGREGLAGDLAALLDHLGLDRVRLLGWSSGGLLALAAASALGGRVAAVLTVGGVPPVEAYDDPAVLDALGPQRRPFVEMAREIPAGELAAEMAPYMVPLPLDRELARAHVLEGAGERGEVDLEAVPGAVDQLVDALIAAVEQGWEWLADEIVTQLSPGLDLGAISARVVTVHGTEDPVSPPAVGRWLADRLPAAEVEVVEGGSHHLLFPHWEALLRRLVRTA